MYTDADADLEWTNLGDTEIREDALYIRRIHMAPGERADFQRVLEGGFCLQTLRQIAYTCKIGISSDPKRRTQSAATDNAANFEVLAMPCKNRKRVECFLIYVFCRLKGKRRSLRDFFLLIEDDIVDIQNKITGYNETGDMVFTYRVTDELTGVDEDREVSINTFADEDQESFHIWWKEKGQQSGMPKPTPSSTIIAEQGT